MRRVLKSDSDDEEKKKWEKVGSCSHRPSSWHPACTTTRLLHTPVITSSFVNLSTTSQLPSHGVSHLSSPTPSFFFFSYQLTPLPSTTLPLYRCMYVYIYICVCVFIYASTVVRGGVRLHGGHGPRCPGREGQGDRRACLPERLRQGWLPFSPAGVGVLLGHFPVTSQLLRKT